MMWDVSGGRKRESRLEIVEFEVSTRKGGTF